MNTITFPPIFFRILLNFRRFQALREGICSYASLDPPVTETDKYQYLLSKQRAWARIFSSLGVGVAPVVRTVGICAQLKLLGVHHHQLYEAKHEVTKCVHKSEAQENKTYEQPSPKKLQR